MSDASGSAPSHAPSHFDLIVIGAGPAGEKGALQAAELGKRVAVVEREAAPGGAAVHTGTLPSKTLRETSIYLSGRHHRELYGISVVVEREHCAPKMMSRKDEVRRQEVARMLWGFERFGVELVYGHARFTKPGEVEVNDADGARTLTGDRFLIATGSSPYRPKDIDFEDPDIEDSDTILEIERVPASLTVIGAGVIGCEYATMFAALGVKVTLIEPRDRILPFLDSEIGARLVNAMKALGIELHLGDRYTKVRRDERGIIIELESGGELVSEQLLFAAGRGGNTSDLGLDAVGVEIGRRGYLVVDEQYQTTAPHIYAAGDCIGFPALASTSMEQGRLAVCAAFGDGCERRVDELLPYGIYTIPEVSCVGLSPDEAKERGHDPIIGRAFYRDNARGKIIGDRDGMVKLVFDRQTRKLLGCHCLGDRASELVHLGQMAIALGGTIESFQRLVFNHPTLSETFKYASLDALGRL